MQDVGIGDFRDIMRDGFLFREAEIIINDYLGQNADCQIENDGAYFCVTDEDGEILKTSPSYSACLEYALRRAENLPVKSLENKL